METNRSEEAHFDSNQLQEQFSAKCASSLPRTPPIAPVMLNAAQRSEASYAIENQLSTKLIISNAVKRSEASYAIENQLSTKLIISNAVRRSNLDQSYNTYFNKYYNITDHSFDKLNKQSFIFPAVYLQQLKQVDDNDRDE